MEDYLMIGYLTFNYISIYNKLIYNLDMFIINI